MLRRDMNSLYLHGSKSAESNTGIFPHFGCSIKAIQWFLKKYYIWFLRHLFKISAYYNKWLKLHLLEVVWCPYDIPVLAFLHLKWYVDRNPLYDLFVFLCSCIHFACFSLGVLHLLSSSWLSFHHIGSRCLDSQIAWGWRNAILRFIGLFYLCCIL
jgi:hypothetical protein